MGQSDVLVCLERSKRPLNIREISEKIKLGERNVQRALRIMVKYNEVKKIEGQGTKDVYKVNGEYL